MGRLLRVMAGLIFGAVMTLGGAADGVKAAPPAGPSAAPIELERSVRQLLTELDAPTRARRDAAMRQIRELGPRVLPLLPAPELLPSAAVRESVLNLRGELEREQARRSIRASKITLHGSRPLSEWLRDLSAQTRNPLDVSGLPRETGERRVSLDLANVDFWPALEKLQHLADLRLAVSPAADRLRLLPRGNAPREAAVTTSGAFRVAARAAQLREVFGAPDRHVVRIPIEVFPEPRLRPLFLHYSASEIGARSANTNLAALSPEAKYEIPLGEGGKQVSLLLDFLSGKADPKQVSLNGKVWFTTAADQEAIRFAGLKAMQEKGAQEIARRRGGVTVTLRRVTRAPPTAEGRELRVEVTVAYDTGGPAFESHRNWILHNSVYLEAAGGQRIPLNGGYETKRQGNGFVSLEYRFVKLPDTLPDYAFVYVAPTLIIDAPVEFQLNPIPVQAK